MGLFGIVVLEFRICFWGISSMAQYDYDLVVIGGGAAGLTSSKLARGLGKKVLLIEKNRLGGECTWTGCIPSKAIIKVAERIHNAISLSNRGIIHLEQSACPEKNTYLKSEVDLSYVMSHVRSCIQQVYETHTPQVLEKSGIDLFFGSAEFTNEKSINIGGKIITSKRYIIATGSRPAMPDLAGLEAVDYLTNENFFSLKELPQSIVLLGGGPIAVELACALNKLGTKVSIIEITDTILGKEDKELTELLRQHMVKQGIAIYTNTKALSIEKHKEHMILHCVDKNDNNFAIEGQRIFIATGRRPNIEGLRLDKAGVEHKKNGIIVDSTLRATNKNMYACGDVVGPYRFSHMAGYQAVVATQNALIPFFKKKINYRHILWVTFADPELATVGLSEDQAREIYGDSIKVYTCDYSGLDRAKTDGSTFGRAKFVINKRGYLLGASILGARAGEIIHEVQLGKYYGIKLAQFYPVLHAYPTYSEVVWRSAQQAYVDNLQNSKILSVLRFLLGFRS